MAHDQGDNIPRATLETVLEGVTVATQASAILHGIVSTWLSSHGLAESHSLTKWHAKQLSQPGTSQSEDARHLFNITLAVSFLREKSRSDSQISLKDLEFTWQLVRNALTSPVDQTKLKYKVSRSAQGFLAIPLCSRIIDGNIDELFRLHVWLPDGQRGKSEVAVHSHQPFAQSWILAGTGTDHQFDVEGTTDPLKATHSEYVPHWDAGKGADATYKTFQAKSSLVSTGKLCVVRERDRQVHSPGMTYSVPSAVYHKSTILGESFHATFFYFDSSRGFYKDAGNLGPVKGGEFSQLRDAGVFTASILANLTDAVRSWEVSQSGSNEESEKRVNDMYHKTFESFRVRAMVEAENKQEV